MARDMRGGDGCSGWGAASDKQVAGIEPYQAVRQRMGLPKGANPSYARHVAKINLWRPVNGTRSPWTHWPPP